MRGRIEIGSPNTTECEVVAECQILVLVFWSVPFVLQRKKQLLLVSFTVVGELTLTELANDLEPQQE